MSKANNYSSRQAAYIFGRIAELNVIMYLLLNGYSVKGWRVRTPVGEVDIVAIDGTALVLIEVKARRCHDDALFAITHHQQDRLKRAAAWLSQHYTTDQFRFDCCSVSWYMRIRYLKNAFI